MLKSKPRLKYQVTLRTPSSSGPGLSGHLMYAFYLTMYSTQSTISSYSGAMRFGVHSLRTPMHMHNIRRLDIRRIKEERSQDNGRL